MQTVLILPSVPPPRYSMPYKPDTDPSIWKIHIRIHCRKMQLSLLLPFVYSLFFDPLTAEF
jgi:hypothetical protein